MKVIPLQNKERLKKLVLQIQKQKPEAQKEIYDMFSSKMLSVCRMYIKDLHYAEDCMIKGFIKAFKNANNFRFEGSFEGWMRRIMVNESLNFLKQQKSFQFIDEVEFEEENTHWVELDFDAQELLDQLPEGYKTIFNLYVMEEWSHKEIAEMLHISESTSKSQYFKAKNKLREALQQLKQQSK